MNRTKQAIHTMDHIHGIALGVLALTLCSCSSLQPLTRSHVTTTRYDAEGRVTETIVEERSESLAKSWIDATKQSDVVISESGWGVKLSAEPQITSGMLPGLTVKAGKLDTVYQRHGTGGGDGEAANIAANKGEFHVGATGVTAGSQAPGGSSDTVKAIRGQVSPAQEERADGEPGGACESCM